MSIELEKLVDVDTQQSSYNYPGIDQKGTRARQFFAVDGIGY